MRLAQIQKAASASPINRDVDATAVHFDLNSQEFKQNPFTRFPQIQLATARSQIRYSSRLGTRALVMLPVRF